ncbi:MAG: rRNA maturation RNase YbeY [Dehalococcoidales bacterium]|nr:rRNA maturation RNase YbeY [Dehalococcoidales bacterium]
MSSIFLPPPYEKELLLILSGMPVPAQYKKNVITLFAPAPACAMITDMEIDILVDEGLAGCPDAPWLEEVAERVLAAQGIGSQAELGLFITSQERIRELNRSYLGKDRPTDVIAFHMLPGGEESKFVLPPDGVLHLGEVVISYPQAVIQAEQQGHSIMKEVAILTIHGILHLLGYQDEEPELKRRMAIREAEILGMIGDILKQGEAPRR